MLYFSAMQYSLHLNLQLVCDLPGGMTPPPPMLSPFYALLKMVWRNYLYGGICIVKHSNNALIYRVNAKTPVPPHSPKDNGSLTCILPYFLEHLCDLTYSLWNLPAVSTDVTLTLQVRWVRLREVWLLVQGRTACEEMMLEPWSLWLQCQEEERKKGPYVGGFLLAQPKSQAYSFSHSTNVYWAWLCAGYMIHMGPLPSQNSRLRRETPSIDKESNKSEDHS